MNFKKLVASAVALMLMVVVSGCSNNGGDEVDQAYIDKYTGFYNTYMGVMSDYAMYNDTDSAIEYYNNYDYPGNEGYVENLRVSYGTRRDAIQDFIDNIETNMQTDDKELGQMNQDLITQGRMRIEDLNKRMEKLDAIPEDIYAHENREDFIRAVDESTVFDGMGTNTYQETLDGINERLKIDSNTDMNK